MTRARPLERTPGPLSVSPASGSPMREPIVIPVVSPADLRAATKINHRGNPTRGVPSFLERDGRAPRVETAAKTRQLISR
uniref:Uncharacterized protein n=1 Tax=Anguilla anguilla TaxID=7936 RepID=A0A0E9S6I3_ANGAN